MNINAHLDYTLLESTTTEREIIDLCNKARENNYFGICVNGSYVSLVKQFLIDTDIKVSTVVGFPLGCSTTKSKIYEAQQALEDGAEEIGMVVNLGYVKSKNYVSVLKDISDVKMAIGDTPLKVIIEISELNKNEIVRVSEICIDARADFIETSTGFSKSGATLTAIKIIKKTIKDAAQIKASGDILDYESAVKYLEVGADRLGISTSFKGLNNNTRQQRNSKIYKQYLESAAKKSEGADLNTSSKETTINKL
ncbi:deoxyribose-phosphate aldolase [Tamlana sp. 2_MG-2023]|uniref:deoxyribose-phosphate aldolase n=1 Tax=unclassified Tamlana TaxID=2614803 RepID=UPI0026E25AAE|nr:MULTISPECIES: deoxyribose-phosphate aldolase [unclassified Tamlana]MDO6758865.1 deoxyribose-phosphate aldolase [Tamlana sp. 2_MG-2023]MDO6789564.1 deoxyribose-phosphate aldolase [Tamlana sp. 1_MG-2023]